MMFVRGGRDNDESLVGTETLGLISMFSLGPSPEGGYFWWFHFCTSRHVSVVCYFLFWVVKLGEVLQFPVIGGSRIPVHQQSHIANIIILIHKIKHTVRHTYGVL